MVLFCESFWNQTMERIAVFFLPILQGLFLYMRGWLDAPCSALFKHPWRPHHSKHTSCQALWPHWFMVIVSGSKSGMVQELTNSISSLEAGRQAGRPMRRDPKEPSKLIYHKQHPYSCHSAADQPSDQNSETALRLSCGMIDALITGLCLWAVTGET